MSKVYSRIPEGYVCTQAAARMLGGVKKSAARALMLRRGVPWVRYRFRGGLTAKAWDEACVRQVAASRPAVVDELPRGCVSFADAREMMGCARSTLYRYVKRGILSDLRGRVQGERGLRDASYFLREEVEQAAERCREMKRMHERAQTRLCAADRGESRIICVGVSKHKELVVQAKTGHVFMPGFVEGNQVGFESKKSPTGTYWFTPADLREIADFAEARKEGEA